MKINDITCKVEIDGADAEEYGEEITDEDEPEKKCYIASQEGKRFAISLDASRNWRLFSKAINYRIYADGERVYNAISDPYSSRCVYVQKTSIESKFQNGLYEERPLVFGKLETSDSTRDGLETRMNVIKDMGTLKVVVWPCTINRTIPAPILPYHDIRALAGQEEKEKPILEKALKGKPISHRVTLGSDVTFKPEETFKVTHIGAPVATFVFHYTTEESLKAQRIITRDGEEDDLEEMSVEELKRELRRRREEEAAEDVLRHKNNRHRRSSVIAPGPTETIDLTEEPRQRPRTEPGYRPLRSLTRFY